MLRAIFRALRTPTYLPLRGSIPRDASRRIARSASASLMRSSRTIFNKSAFDFVFQERGVGLIDDRYIVRR